MTAFADVLRELRASRALTQEELAERAGLTVKAVSALERGERRRPYPHTVRSLAHGLALDEGERARLVGAVPSRPAVRAAPAGPAPGPRPVLGREADLDVLCGWLSGEPGVVITLTGPGGVGKTTLALAAAERVVDRFAGGVTIVDLAATTDPGRVLAAVATAAGVPDGGSVTSAADLAPYLESRRLLLVLDNLEQVLDAAGQVADLVSRSPGLMVLATSRAPLRIRPEREYRVPPLSQQDAVRLFQDVAGHGSAPPDQADAVEELCRQAEGLPLAVELVASAAATLGARALLDRVGLVADGPRDLPERQRSMTATLGWSVQLLDPASRDLLGRLASLAGTFTVATADAVLDGDALPPLRVLLEHSLATRAVAVGGIERYRLLEPVRQYAAQRWPSQPETRARLAGHVHHMSRVRGQQLRGAGIVPALDELSADHAQVAAGWADLVERGRHDDAADVLWQLWLHHALRGHVHEGQAWARELDGRPMSDASRARLLVARAGLEYVAGDIAALRRSSAAAMALLRHGDDHELTVDAVLLATNGAVFAGDVPAAVELLAEGDRILASAPVPWGSAQLDIVRGQLAMVSGDLAGAEAILERAETGARELDNAFSLAVVLNVRATLTELVGDHQASARLLAEATELSAGASMSWTLAYSLPALAGVAVRLGDAASGARLFGASGSYAARHGVATTFEASGQLAARDLAEARDALGETAFREEWDAGRAATMEDVAELARAVTDRARG